jgi:hypothetical protein
MSRPMLPQIPSVPGLSFRTYQGEEDIRAIAELLRERGMTSAQLDVDTENANRALSLYERHGFVSDRSAGEWHRRMER